MATNEEVSDKPSTDVPPSDVASVEGTRPTGKPNQNEHSVPTTSSSETTKQSTGARLITTQGVQTQQIDTPTPGSATPTKTEPPAPTKMTTPAEDAESGPPAGQKAKTQSASIRQATEAESSTQSPSNTGTGSGVSGWSVLVGQLLPGIIGLVLLAGVGWFVLLGPPQSQSARIFIDVSMRDELTVTGAVLSHGLTVDNGTVHIVITNARNKQYLAGGAQLVNSDGKFTFKTVLPRTTSALPLRIDASFEGPATNPQGSSIPLVRFLGSQFNIDLKALVTVGEETLYINFPPPFGDRSVASVVLAFAGSIVLLIWLFTGPLSPRKARLLFGVTYFITFLSLAIPIIFTIVVFQDPYLRELMAGAPLSLVRAKAAGTDSQQWLINIGGVARLSLPRDQTGNPRMPIPATTAQVEKAIASDNASSGAIAGATQVVSAIGESAGAPLPEGQDGIGNKAPVQAANNLVKGEKVPVALIGPDLGDIALEGGVAVPFYVLLLAMFGAGINMTLKVPKIQGQYDAKTTRQEKGFWGKLFSGETTSQDQENNAIQIRQNLIENFMYLLSAPFLAIAVYYLLQVVAKDINVSVMVLMAFATGLISDSMVKAIIKFARKTLGDGEDEPSEKDKSKMKGSPDEKHDEQVAGVPPA